MSDQETLTYTSSVEAQHAERLRIERDKTDADIGDDFLQVVSDDRIRAERALETTTRRRWETSAVESAVHNVINDYLAAGGRTTFIDHTRGVAGGPARDLEGVTVTVTVADLVATATLTAPATATHPATSSAS